MKQFSYYYFPLIPHLNFKLKHNCTECVQQGFSKTVTLCYLLWDNNRMKQNTKEVSLTGLSSIKYALWTIFSRLLDIKKPGCLPIILWLYSHRCPLSLNSFMLFYIYLRKLMKLCFLNITSNKAAKKKGIKM